MFGMHTEAARNRTTNLRLLDDLFQLCMIHSPNQSSFSSCWFWYSPSLLYLSETSCFRCLNGKCLLIGCPSKQKILRVNGWSCYSHSCIPKMTLERLSPSSAIIHTQEQKNGKELSSIGSEQTLLYTLNSSNRTNNKTNHIRSSLIK